MPLAIDTAAFFATNPGAGFTTATNSPGDSNRVRDFQSGSKAILTQVIRKGAAAGAVRIFSPVMHDAVRGITFQTSESPSRFLLPAEIGEPMQAGDTLTIQLTGGTAETDLAVLQFYYQDLAGSAARLFMWQDIVGAIEHVKPLLVAVNSGGTPGTWVDTALNATEDLFKADRQYAVLGYVTDVVLGAIAVKGSDTGNLRVGGPGQTTSDNTSNFFVNESQRHNTPMIPVIKANNKAAAFVSIVNDVANVAANVQLVLALLAPTFAL